MRDYLNGDIDSGCGSLSREDPMFLGIPRQVVPPLIICDSSVRDAQMTRYFARKRLEESALNKEGCFRYCSQRYLESNRLYGGCFNYLLRTEMALVCAPTELSHCFYRLHFKKRMYVYKYTYIYISFSFTAKIVCL